MKDIILFGIQWSGKWTQAKLLLEQMTDSFAYFAMWDVFRTLTSTDNALGLYLKNRMAAGELIKDEVTNSLFEAYVHAVLHDEKYMLLDWYPRTLQQMKTTMWLLSQHDREVLGIQFVIPDEIALERMRGRWRSDDTEDAMKHRIQQFYDNTQPTIDWFEEKYELVTIDATQSMQAIHKQVLSLCA